MPELKEALGTGVDMAVFRKLREIGYRSSYSDRGKYYTLAETPDFDEHGLWSHERVRFSRHGTLLKSCEALIGESRIGYSASELKSILHVGVMDALRKLVGEGRILRQEAQGEVLYLCAEAATRRRQIVARAASRAGASSAPPSDEVKAAIVLSFALFNEKQRRLYAGLEALKLRPGGEQWIAGLLGVDPATVRRGRQEQLAGDFESERIRRPGGGRKPLEKKRQE